MKILYAGLEPYRERYTEQLTHWVSLAACRAGVSLEPVEGERGSGLIETGVVLDAHQRARWGLVQTSRLIGRLPDFGASDWVWLDDLFHPGYEALAYVLAQTPVAARPRLVVRNWAQSVDPDDFTHAMLAWMRPYEEMVVRTSALVLVASDAHADMWRGAGLAGQPGQADLLKVGLPFNSGEVRHLAPPAIDWAARPRRVVYSSRLDREKQPHFLMDLVEQLAGEMEFVVCTGSAAPRSNDPGVLARLGGLADRGLVRVAAGLSKRQYYAELSAARVQLNTARQDFVSFTALEASALGVATLAPCFRSFPEELPPAQLYAPWSLADAAGRLRELAGLPGAPPGVGALAARHDGTLDRTFRRLALAG